MQSPKILLFDLEHAGHHATYLCHLIKYWQLNKVKGTLFIVVTPTFNTCHPEVKQLIEECNEADIKIVPVSVAEEDYLKSRSKIGRRLEEWKILSKYAHAYSVDHCLIMFIDKLQIPIILQKELPCSFSGIFFRPSFHYPSFLNSKTSAGDRFQHLREKLFLNRLLRNPHAGKIFCLDPFASDLINDYYKTTKVVKLPDPIEPQIFKVNETKNLASSLKLDVNRKVFLVFGDLSKRKGIGKIFEAIGKLEDDICEGFCLLLVGNAGIEEKKSIDSKIQELIQLKPIQIITRYGYVANEDISPYFDVSDAVLALYQRHIGMSGILLLAASRKKPVIATNYGLMGEIVRQYSLGVGVDSSISDEISEAFSEFISGEININFNEKAAQNFVQENDAQKFSETIFQEIFDYLKREIL